MIRNQQGYRQPLVLALAFLTLSLGVNGHLFAVDKPDLPIPVFTEKPPLQTPPSNAPGELTFNHPDPMHTHGWSWKMPPDLVTPDCGKRCNIFYVGDPLIFKLGGAALTFEVRDYWGTLVDSGKAGESITIKSQPPGWYKLYIFGAGQQIEDKGNQKVRDIDNLLGDATSKIPPRDRRRWQDVVGGTTFVIFRDDPNFPKIPNDAPFFGNDEFVRGLTGMGPQRHSADANKPDETIAQLENDIPVDAKYYLPYDPARHRALMIAFPGGTKNLEGVKKIVEHFKKYVKYWEPRNEPNYGSSGADFAKNEMKPFYDTVKSIDPSLKVLGPGTVSIGPGLEGWIADFLKGGGGQYIDAFSFHAYNNVNGDLWLTRTSMNALTDTLKQAGLGKIELWQTEQGFMTPVYGDYQPHLQGRWTMLEILVFEQYGLTKEHNHLWYDTSHGFWDEPMWFENDDHSLNPSAPLMRVYSEEVFGKNFQKAYDFGPVGNKLYFGNLYTGEKGNTAALMSAGSTDGKVEVTVSGGTKLHLVSCFGVESDIPVTDGKATIPVPEMPVYVELAAGQTMDVMPMDFGPDLALEKGTTAVASGTGKNPMNGTPTDIHKVINGEMENWYWSMQPNADVWMDNTNGFPAWVEIHLPKAESVSRVIIYACPPWQCTGTLTDYELQYDDNGKWVTLEHVQEPLKTFGVFSPPVHCSVDSFFSDRWIFQHSFPAVTTSKIRILVHNCTVGGGATQMMPLGGGQCGPQNITLREVEIYGK